MKIGIIGAMQIEVDNLKAHMEDVSAALEKYLQPSVQRQ